MCFSANASFGIGTVLMVAGIASVKKINMPSQIMFATIPLLFAIQQFTEGIVWLGLTDPAYSNWLKPSTYIFLVFAQVCWPTWVPLSILALEKNEKRKKVLASIALLGISVSTYLAYCLLNYQVDASISKFHIRYDLAFPHAIINYTGIFYLIPTVLPPFFSRIKKMYLLGYINLLSFIVAKLFFGEHIISVWCFFAAALSIIVLLIMRGKATNPSRLPDLIPTK
jgi:hypothetical protein